MNGRVGASKDKPPSERKLSNLLMVVAAAVGIPASIVQVAQWWTPNPSPPPAQVADGSVRPSATARSEAEIALEIERARREILEKQMADQVRERERQEAEQRAALEREKQAKASAEAATRERQQAVRPRTEPELAPHAIPRSDGARRVAPQDGRQARIDPGSVAPPFVVKRPAPPLPTEYDRSGCAIFSGYDQGPIPITSGTRICSRDGMDDAVIERVSDGEISFKVNGGFLKTCRPGEHCAFVWSNGQLMFRIKLGQSRAELMPSRL